MVNQAQGLTHRKSASTGTPIPVGGERTAMPGKGADFSSKAINALAAMAAAFVARKAISFAWTKATGRPPPDAADDVFFGTGQR